MSALWWTKIRAGFYVSGHYNIVRSVLGSRQWIVRFDDRELGFRPTLKLAQRLAERMGRAA